MLDVSGHALAMSCLVAVFVIFVGTGPLFAFLINRRMPWSISNRVEGGRRVKIRTTYAGSWNPGKPLGRNNSRPNEPGRATYTLTADGMIQLDLIRRDGSHERSVGPPVQPPAGRRARSRITAIPSLVYLIGSGGGVTIGLLAARGATGAVLGALLGLIISRVGLIAAAAVMRSRSDS